MKNSSNTTQQYTLFEQKQFVYRTFLNSNIEPYYVNPMGALFSNDCLTILPYLKEESIDTVFLDPPFNLNKIYGKNSKDNLSESEYLNWCYKWLDECIRILRSGGSIFVYNLPKWNLHLGSYIANQGMDFRHWIAIKQGNTFPIPKKLYPSHYSLLYFTKGSPNTFNKIRTPIEKCRHCGGELRDYGGHRKAMNPNGVNLQDIWTDIPPVRHWKFKSQNRRANALSTKLLDRVVEISTNPGDIVLDPFGGSGTTFAVCEKKHRHWLGIEWDFCDVIQNRLETGQPEHHENSDFVER
jgi:site-specific DNA-methyltransferase (adenine-specific)